MKPKKYNWKDSNLALFGSKLEREVKSKYLLPNMPQVLFMKKNPYGMTYMFMVFGIASVFINAWQNMQAVEPQTLNHLPVGFGQILQVNDPVSMC